MNAIGTHRRNCAISQSLEHPVGHPFLQLYILHVPIPTVRMASTKNRPEKPLEIGYCSNDTGSCLS